MRPVLFLLPPVLAVALFASGCKGKDETKDSTKYPKLTELKKEDIVVGKGPLIRKGDVAYVVYTGKLVDGTVFDSNENEGAQPLSFKVGFDSMIQGFHLGVEGMRVGGKRKLSIPSKMAYGEHTPSEQIPPNSDLYFTITALDAVRVGEEDVFDKTDVNVGSGKAAKIGSLVEVNYKLSLVNNKVIDSQMDPAKPVRFRLGPKIKDSDRRVPPGVSYGIAGMKEGGVRKLRIPPAVGFAGDISTGIPTNSILKIEVKLLKVLE